MESKKAWQSKTVWMGLLVALSPFVPGASEFISKNPELVSLLLGSVFTLLRLISKDKVVIS